MWYRYLYIYIWYILGWMALGLCHKVLIKINLEGWFPNLPYVRLLKGQLQRGYLDFLMYPAKGPWKKHDFLKWPSARSWFSSWGLNALLFSWSWWDLRGELSVSTSPTWRTCFHLEKEMFKDPTKSSNLRLGRFLRGACSVSGPENCSNQPEHGEIPRCVLQRIRITFGKWQKWFAINWNWNRWEVQLFAVRLVLWEFPRVNGLASDPISWLCSVTFCSNKIQALYGLRRWDIGRAARQYLSAFADYKNDYPGLESGWGKQCLMRLSLLFAFQLHFLKIGKREVKLEFLV